MTYTIAETNLDRQVLLADFLNPITLHALEDISIGEGARILDVGCGLGETSLLLATRFPGTTVTGIDWNGALIDVANATRAWKNPALQFLSGDATKLPFDDNSFDFVFTRYLLHHLPEPSRGLTELVRVAKSGGRIFVEEPDANFLASYPDSWAYPKAISIVNTLFADALMGRKLIGYFNNAGLTDIRYLAESAMAGSESTLKTFYTQTAIALKEAIVKKGLMTEQEYLEWVAELTRAEKDPDTIVLVHPTISVWGKKA